MFYDPTVPENQMGCVYKHMVWSLKGSKTTDQLGASVIPQTIKKLCDKKPGKSKHPQILKSGGRIITTNWYVLVKIVHNSDGTPSLTLCTLISCQIDNTCYELLMSPSKPD